MIPLGQVGQSPLRSSMGRMTWTTFVISPAASLGTSSVLISIPERFRWATHPSRVARCTAPASRPSSPLTGSADDRKVLQEGLTVPHNGPVVPMAGGAASRGVASYLRASKPNRDRSETRNAK